MTTPNPPLNLPRHNKMAGGPISAVCCPWCGKHNDFRDIEASQLEKGLQIDCDHCGNVSVVKGVAWQPRIQLAQYHGG